MPAEAQMNTAVYEMAPDIPARLRARGDEILGHGVTNSDEQGHLAEDQERALIDERDGHHRAPRGRPAGWLDEPVALQQRRSRWTCCRRPAIGT